MPAFAWCTRATGSPVRTSTTEIRSRLSYSAPARSTGSSIRPSLLALSIATSIHAFDDVRALLAERTHLADSVPRIDRAGLAPESFVGGPLALVETGDEIEIDVDKRSIHLHVSDAELARRKAAWKAPPPKYPRGYGAMFSEHIGQADQGCDFDFLAPLGPVPEPEIH